jgi:Sec-independent protein translocase protein TatA
MIEQFEKLESAINGLGSCIEEMKKENDRLKKEAQELKGVIEDRDLEILQLQEDLQKKSTAHDTEKNDIEHKLEGLLGRVSSMTAGKTGTQ